MHDHAIANNTDGLWVEDARGHQVKGVLVPGLVIDRVSSIGASLLDG